MTKGDNVLKLKSKLLAGAGTLVVAGSMMGAIAPSAHATTTNTGACQGAVSFIKLTSPTKGVGLTDRTVAGVKAAGGLAKDQTSKLLVNGGGTCTGHWRPGDPHNPGHLNTDPLINLTAKAQATALLGNATCATGAAEQALDTGATANTWPLNGKITWTFNQTYFDPVAAVTKPYKMQADIALLGIGANGDGADVVSVGGVVLSGVNAGAMLATFQTAGAFHSSVWEDPVSKTGGASGFNTGYELDLAQAVGCADGDGGGETATQGNANILQVLTGGGGASATSLLGSSANGLVFEFGQP
jgi:hypothetical protein